MDLGDPKAPDLLNRAWSLIGEWVEAFLDDHPDAAPDDIASSFRALNVVPANPNRSFDGYELSGNAVKLSPGAYAVAAYFPLVGTFFVVARNQQGEFRVLWDIKKVALAHFAARDELGRWAYLCSMDYGDGPLIGSVHLLPESVTKHPRFYVDAVANCHGGTLPGQLSIWEWNGVEAIPLLIGGFYSYIDGHPNEFDGQLLKLHTKERLKTINSYGWSPDPEVLWTIRITPEGVEDLGRKDVVPELRMVDELWYRLTNGLAADDFASPQVISEINRLVEYVKAEDTGLDEYKSLSMLGAWKITRENDHEILYFTAERLDCNQLRFEIDQRQGKLFFADLKVRDKCESTSDTKSGESEHQ